MRPVQPSAPLQRLPDGVLQPTVGNVFETTVEQLATAIRLRVFVTGEQLPPERELADRHGVVARNTLRDAIAALRAPGLVSTRRGRGGGSVVTYSGGVADARRVADSRLHLAIATLTGSPMVVQTVTRAQAALGELLAAIPVLARNIEHSHDQHDAVVAAVLDRDGEAARTSMEEHCDATSALLRGLIG
jgi:GntR family transcriptional repressor for pyruvate dehydrogenase complex